MSIGTVVRIYSEGAIYIKMEKTTLVIFPSSLTTKYCAVPNMSRHRRRHLHLTHKLYGLRALDWRETARHVKFSMRGSVQHRVCAGTERTGLELALCTASHPKREQVVGRATRDLCDLTRCAWR